MGKSEEAAHLFHRVQHAREFIEKNYYRDISVSDIAASAHLSPSHLTRSFSEAFSSTPYQYVIEIRLAKARQLLGDSLFSIEEIIQQIGFYSASSFIRLYKKRFGETPGSTRSKNIGHRIKIQRRNAL